MPEVREVFDMATQKVRPDPDSLEQQHHDQRRHAARQKAAVFVLLGVLVVGAVAFGISTVRSDESSGVPLDSNPPPSSATSPPTVAEGPLEPGRYVIETTDPQFNTSHRITIDVPEGYSGWGSVGVFKDALDAGDTGVAMWVVQDVYADACNWRGTRTPISSAADLASALARQQTLRIPRAPRPTEFDGFTGMSMTMTTPTLAKIDGCDRGRFALWWGGGQRYLNNPGESQDLWMLDIDGSVLVIDAPVGADAQLQDRDQVYGDLVGSIRIHPGGLV
jgi:hypothetical protein